MGSLSGAAPLVRLKRGSLDDLVFRGAVAVTPAPTQCWDSDIGNTDDVWGYLRSTAKPLQCLPTLGLWPPDTFVPQEIALFCASHTGKRFHLHTLNDLMDRMGVSPSDLTCGPPPERPHRRMLDARYHPCSGNHLALLLAARRLPESGFSTTELQHPVQQQILEIVAQSAHVTPPEIEIGIDGCGIPTFGLPLCRIAQVFLSLVHPARFPESFRSACQTVVRSMTSYPEYVAGPRRLTTDIMKIAKGRLLAKSGAGGLFAMAIIPKHPMDEPVGIAIKMADGNMGLARNRVILRVLEKLNILDPKKLKTLQGRFCPDFRSPQGEISATWDVLF